MSKLKPFYTTPPAELKPGDVFACTFSVHIQAINHKEKTIWVKAYRDDYPLAAGATPEGGPISFEDDKLAGISH